MTNIIYIRSNENNDTSTLNSLKKAFMGTHINVQEYDFGNFTDGFKKSNGEIKAIYFDLTNAFNTKEADAHLNSIKSLSSVIFVENPQTEAQRQKLDQSPEFLTVEHTDKSQQKAIKAIKSICSID